MEKAMECNWAEVFRGMGDANLEAGRRLLENIHYNSAKYVDMPIGDALHYVEQEILRRDNEVR